MAVLCGPGSTPSRGAEHHRFARAYGAGFEPKVYDSLLDMVGETELASEGLAPRDRIDLQSFVWVVGAYDEPYSTVET